MNPEDQDELTAAREAFRNVRAIYFDLDDTLCAYWDASKAGLRQAFCDHMPDGLSLEQCIGAWSETFIPFARDLKNTHWYETYLKEAGPTRTEQMRRALERLGIEDPSLASRLSEAYLYARDEALELFDDVIPVLEALSARYPLGLITNGPADVQRMEIATLGIERFFQNIYIEGEMGEGKPKPAVFHRAAEVVGCQPHEVLMVGNSFRHDIQPAIENGWKSVWVRRPSDVPPGAGSSKAEPEKHPAGAPHPDAVVGDLKSLLELLA